MLRTNFSRGILAVFGNLLVDISVGEINLLGFLYPYLVSYFRLSNPEIEMKDMKIIPMMWMIAQILSCPLGIFVYMRLGFRTTYVIFITSFCLVQWFSSYIQNFYYFGVIYGLSGGLSQGALLVLPIYCGWRYFHEKHKPRIAGILLSAYAISPLFTSQIALRVINPGNRQQVVEVVGDEEKRYFGEEVAMRVPSFLRYFGLICFVVGMLGVLLILEPVEEDSEEEVGEGNSPNQSGKIAKQSFSEAVQCFKERKFIALYLAIIFGYLFPHLMNFSFKDIGLKHLQDDRFVTFAGSAGAISNALSRFFVGFFFEWFGYGKTVIGITLLAIITSQFYLPMADNRATFFIFTCLFEVTYGGQLGIYPLITDKLFGDKGAITYSYLFSGFTISLLTSLSLYSWLVPKIGLRAHFMIIGGLTAINLAFVFWSKMYEDEKDKSADRGKEADGEYVELLEMGNNP